MTKWVEINSIFSFEMHSNRRKNNKEIDDKSLFSIYANAIKIYISTGRL